MFETPTGENIDKMQELGNIYLQKMSSFEV